MEELASQDFANRGLPSLRVVPKVSSFVRGGVVLTVAAAIAVTLHTGLKAQDPVADQLRQHFARGDDAYREGRLDDAIREFREAVRLRPSLAEAHAKLGVIYYSRNEFDLAANAFREAVRQKPELARAAALLGIASVRSGNLDEAIPLLEKGAAVPPDPDLGKQCSLFLMEAYHKLGRLDEALDLGRKMVAADPGDADLLYSVYRLHSELGSRAVADLFRVAPGSARLHQVTAEMLESQGDHIQAADQYRRAVRKDPALPGIRRALAVAILNASGEEQARAEARHELELELQSNPADFHAIRELGEIDWTEGRFEEALARFTRALDLHPEFVEALIGLGKVATRLGDMEAALPALERAASLAPENETARYRLSQLYRRMGRTADAERELARFEVLREASASIAEIYQQVLRRPAPSPAVEEQP